MEFTTKELNILYSTLFHSVFNHILKNKIEDESELDELYTDQLSVMRKIKHNVIFEEKILEAMKGGY
jgi:hypothetical protein